MKRISLLCLAAVLLLFLTACGTLEQPKEPEAPASSESEASSQTEATESSSKSNDSKPNTEPERDAGEGSNKTSEKNSEPDDNKEFSIEAYSAAIEDAIDYANEQAEFQTSPDDDPSSLLSDLGGLGYALYDLDGTGAPELLIGFNDDQDDFVHESILLIYTLENNQPKRLFESWIPVACGCGDLIQLHEDNIICHYIVDEYSGASNDYYRVSNGSTQLIEACAHILDEEYPYELPFTYVYSTTFDDAFNNKDKFDIVDQATVERTIAKYGDPIPIDYTPLTDLN